MNSFKRLPLITTEEELQSTHCVRLGNGHYGHISIEEIEIYRLAIDPLYVRTNIIDETGGFNRYKVRLEWKPKPR